MKFKPATIKITSKSMLKLAKFRKHHLIYRFRVNVNDKEMKSFKFDKIIDSGCS